jgi:hypothetical protein
MPTDVSDMDTFAPGDAEHYQDEWRRVQAGFVDDPEAAVRDADKLVEQVMADVAHKLSRHRDTLATGGSGERTEQLRVALRRYRALFQQLTGTTANGSGDTAEPMTAHTTEPTAATMTEPTSTGMTGSTSAGMTGPTTDSTSATMTEPPARPTRTQMGAEPIEPEEPPVIDADDARTDVSETPVDRDDELVEHRADAVGDD